MKTWLRAALAVTLLGSTPVLARAQYTWNGPTSGNWQDPLNWSGGPANTFPGLTGSGQAGQGAFASTAAFGSLTDATTVQIEYGASGAGQFLALQQISNTTAQALTIQNTSGTSGELILDGRSPGNPILSNTGAGSITIRSNPLGGGLSVRLYSDFLAGSGQSSYINVSGTGPVTISATIQDSTGGTGLTKIGSGSLFLEGVNTYTGVTRVFDGTLHANSNAALGSGNASVEIRTGAKFQAESSFTTNRNFLLSTGTGSDGTIRASAGTTLNINGDVTQATSANLVKAGLGLVNLNGTVSVNAVSVTEGSLGGSGTINAPVTVSNSAHLTAGTGAGSSTLTINNALNLGGSTTYDVRLFGTGYTNPNSADISKVAVSGSVTLPAFSVSPELTLDLSALSSAQAQSLRDTVGHGNTQKYYVMTTSDLIGGGSFIFSIANMGNFMAGEWTYGGIESFAGGHAVFLNFTPAPEPHAILGIAGAVMGLLSIARRMRQSFACRTAAV